MIVPARGTGHALRTGRLLAGTVGYRRKLPEDGRETSRKPARVRVRGRPDVIGLPIYQYRHALVAPTRGMGAR
jgi:hypothetical protein